MPAPMIAFTRLDVAPHKELLCSFCEGGSFLTRRDVPPGVETWTSFRGVDGAKKGDLGGLGAMMVVSYGECDVW